MRILIEDVRSYYFFTSSLLAIPDDSTILLLLDLDWEHVYLD
jgi:hypothetical protein